MSQMVVDMPTATSFLPQGRNSKDLTLVLDALRSCAISPVFAFQITIGSPKTPEPPMATRSPCGETRATVENRRPGRSRCCKTSPETELQMVAVLSLATASTRSPSGKTCASRNRTLRPSSKRSSRSTSAAQAHQTTTAPPAPTDTSRSPDGKNFASTGLCPGSTRCRGCSPSCHNMTPSPKATAACRRRGSVASTDWSTSLGNAPLHAEGAPSPRPPKDRRAFVGTPMRPHKSSRRAAL
mmetsp:Transcript_10407/g.30198  ORF Transcript_10407/g.30198 Transcript_10407/m.30198 type:complete len:240 (-) Transcript_10407:54-773(-)